LIGKIFIGGDKNIKRMILLSIQNFPVF